MESSNPASCIDLISKMESVTWRKQFSLLYDITVVLSFGSFKIVLCFFAHCIVVIIALLKFSGGLCWNGVYYVPTFGKNK